MKDFFVNNAGTLFVLAIIVIWTVLVLRSMIRNRKSGKNSCGDCSCCPSERLCKSSKTRKN